MFNLPENELFCCEHLRETKEQKSLIKNFRVQYKQGEGLSIFLKHRALIEENNSLARTYLVLDKETKELVAYFTLKAGLMSQNDFSIEKPSCFDSIPGVEISNFAVNYNYKLAHNEYEGLGKIVFYYFIMPLIKQIATYLGVKMIYVFALPEVSLINYYKKLNFCRLPKDEEKKLHIRIKPKYDQECIFMFQTID